MPVSRCRSMWVRWRVLAINSSVVSRVSGRCRPAPATRATNGAGGPSPAVSITNQWRVIDATSSRAAAVSTAELQDFGQQAPRRGFDVVAVRRRFAHPDQQLRLAGGSSDLRNGVAAHGYFGHVRQRAGGHASDGALE